MKFPTQDRPGLPLLVVLALAHCTLLACAATSGRDDVPPEIAERVNPVELEDSELRYYKRQFKGKCSRCHGPEGTGAGEQAASQPVPPTDFTDATYMQTRSDGQLFYQILVGGGERCAMPAFGPESDYAWNEEKIWHLVAYVRRFANASGQSSDK
jgi:mono/diheme cytochrome c family protein